MVRFEAELSVSSLEALIKDLEKYQKDLDNSMYAINEAIANKAYELLMIYTPYLTGELRESIQKEITSEFARLYTDNDHAMFAEFGTGVVGKGKPHPKAAENGWVYDYKDQNWTGYEGRKYMYQTYIDIQKELIPIAEQVLKQRGLI